MVDFHWVLDSRFARFVEEYGLGGRGKCSVYNLLTKFVIYNLRPSFEQSRPFPLYYALLPPGNVSLFLNATTNLINAFLPLGQSKPRRIQSLTNSCPFW